MHIHCNSHRFFIIEILFEGLLRTPFLKGSDDVRSHLVGDGSRHVRHVDRLRLRLRPALKERVMTIDYSLAALVTAGLLIYLTYALLRPERF
jgi:K+-transporting ATPase KdpF subunit